MSYTYCPARKQSCLVAAPLFLPSSLSGSCGLWLELRYKNFFLTSEIWNYCCLKIRYNPVCYWYLHCATKQKGFWSIVYRIFNPLRYFFSIIWDVIWYSPLFRSENINMNTYLFTKTNINKKEDDFAERWWMMIIMESVWAGIIFDLIVISADTRWNPDDHQFYNPILFFTPALIFDQNVLANKIHYIL